MLVSGLLFAGCASRPNEFSSVPGPSGGVNPTSAPQTVPAAPTEPTPPAAPAPETQPAQPAPVVTPDNSLAGKIVDYNAVGRFVVINFPVGQMAKMDQTFFIYRNGLKVGEVKITGPQSDNSIIADLVNGEAQTGDDARSE